MIVNSYIETLTNELDQNISLILDFASNIFIHFLKIVSNFLNLIFNLLDGFLLLADSVPVPLDNRMSFKGFLMVMLRVKLVEFIVTILLWRFSLAALPPKTLPQVLPVFPIANGVKVLWVFIMGALIHTVSLDPLAGHTGQFYRVLFPET